MQLVHPDLLWKTSLATQIKQYDFWDYLVSEALYLSEKEEAVLVHILQNILQESHPFTFRLKYGTACIYDHF